MILSRTAVLFILSLATLCSYAQTDSVWHKELAIISISESIPLGKQKTIKTESLSGLSDAGQGLSNTSATYIKSYGLGSLATLSLWGGSASQTLVTWEDLPITNPMLGLTDLSLIPMTRNQEVKLNKGGASTTHSSGALTGVMSIHQPIHYSDLVANLTLDLWKGSFGEYGSQFNINKSGKQFYLDLSAFHKQADNNFNYNRGNQVEQLENADFSLTGITLTSGYLINVQNQLQLNLWLQESEKGIPPTLTQTRSVARQEDKLNRLKVKWTHTNDKYKFVSHLAVSDEDNNYADPQILLTAENSFLNLYHSSLLQYYWAKTKLTTKYDLTKTKGFSKSYDASQEELNIFSSYVELEHQLDRFHLTAALRKEWRTFATPPITPLLELRYTLSKWSSSIKLSREYRAPTLNELYWVPGGNKDLRPENGWNKELWINYRYEPKGLAFTTAFYHRKINDWILWAPLENQFIWSALNLGAVRSYGFDTEISKRIRSANWSQEFQLAINYNRSENLIEQRAPRIEQGDQLIYTPLWNTHAGYRLDLNKLRAGIDLNYTSSARGINEDVAAFYNTRFFIHYDIIYKHTTNTFSFTIDNLLDADYRVIERRPMPGRQFILKWTLNFNKT